MKIRVPKQSKIKIALVIFGIHTILLLVKILPAYLSALEDAKDAEVLSKTVIGLVVFYYLMALKTPLILWLGYHFPFRGKHTVRNSFLHIIFAIGLGIAHLCIYLLILIAFDLSSMDSFDRNFSNIPVFINTTFSSIVFYAIAIAIQQAYLYFKESQERAFRLQEAELQMLRMQLQPHFLFNTLNAISALIYKAPRDADRTITQLSDLLRISLKGGKTQEITLKEELEFLQAYLRIHQTLMRQRLEVKWNIDSETFDALIPHMMMQPIVENSIKHGLAPLESGGRIEISAARRNGTLQLQMSDNGQGLDEKKSIEGIGLSNTRIRLRSLYGENHKLIFSSPAEGGLTVNIEIPFREWQEGIKE